ncbi:hypothetical protein PHMEG_0006687 [Phytophthora megakarya]|uniref:Uncharacterized protein n=1 Tax=Phytophthora megakarya TaxID=4795 RepID=A0A225WNB0_9STRA|nr:hypothetical protein PHMEG_0006687 [Phytophthora megakarya]
MGPSAESAEQSTALSEATNKALAFDMTVRLWRVEVNLATRKLLSLGRTYEVRYSLPRSPVENLQLSSHLGLSVASIMKSHLFQVQKTSSPQFAMEFADKVAGRSTNSPICTVEKDDYLVGMDNHDFLIWPRKIKQLDEDVKALGAEVAIKEEQGKSARRTIVLRFVRMGASVQPDPRLDRSPGRMLRVLDEISIHFQQLINRYSTIIQQDRGAVKKLNSAKHLLMYVKVMTGDTRNTLMENRTFQITDEFRKWYAAIKSEAEDDTHVEKDAVMTEIEQPVEDMMVDMSLEQPETDRFTNNAAVSATTTSILRQQSSRALVVKKRVTFAAGDALEQVKSIEQITRTTETSGPTPTPAAPKTIQVQQNGSTPVTKPRTYGVDEGRAYLLALVGPHVDLVSSLQALASTVQTVEMLSVNKEFALAQGLKLRRELRKTDSAQYIARVRLGHLLYGDMLSYLKSQFGFCTANDTRKVKDATFSYLITKKIVQFHEKSVGERGNVTYDVVAHIQGFPLVCRRGSNPLETKNDAVNALMTFLMELIDQHEENLNRDHAEQIKNEFEQSTNESAESFPPHDVDADPREVDAYSEVDSVHESMHESTGSVENGDRREAELRSMGILRKRQYAPHTEEDHEDVRGAPRPRLSYSAPVPEAQTQVLTEQRYTDRENDGAAAANTTSLFVEDRSGLDPNRSTRPRSEDAIAKSKSDVYQELLMLLFRDREKVVRAVTGIVWNLRVKSETIKVSSSFTVGSLELIS